MNKNFPTWDGTMQYLYETTEPIQELKEMSKHYRVYSQSEALYSVTNNQYIVGSINQSGEFSISKTPAIHATAQTAKAEAKRLATNNTGVAYVVLTLESAYLAGGVQEY